MTLTAAERNRARSLKARHVLHVAISSSPSLQWIISDFHAWAHRPRTSTAGKDLEEPLSAARYW